MRLTIRPDPERAEALARLASLARERAQASDPKYAVLVLLDYYTALHQLMDALALQRGVRFSGEGAHRELIDWLAAERLVGERERVFLQELREARNNALYEGKASVISLSALDAHYGLLSGLV